jgi:hypothetical protein
MLSSLLPNVQPIVGHGRQMGDGNEGWVALALLFAAYLADQNFAQESLPMRQSA